MGKRERFTCPRREEIPGQWARQENQDKYIGGHGLPSQAKGCTFCGSMPGDDFIAAIRAGCDIGPTDKSYKAYVNDRGGVIVGKFYFQHLSEEQQDEFVELWNTGELQVGPPGFFSTLPYFVELERKEGTA